MRGKGECFANFWPIRLRIFSDSRSNLLIRRQNYRVCGLKFQEFQERSLSVANVIEIFEVISEISMPLEVSKTAIGYKISTADVFLCKTIKLVFKDKLKIDKQMLSSGNFAAQK